MSAEPESPRKRPPALAPALRLALGALLAVAVLQLLVELTRQPIADAKQAMLERSLATLLPKEGAQADAPLEQFDISAPGWLKGDPSAHVYRRGPHHVVIETRTQDGYAGEIRLLVGLSTPGAVVAVRVTEHHETPGLGDAIEAEKSDWIEQFRGRIWAPDQARAWQVDKDGGEFDTMAGATITSRAMVDAVERVAALHRQHFDAIVSAPAGIELRIDDAPASPAH